MTTLSKALERESNRQDEFYGNPEPDHTKPDELMGAMMQLLILLLQRVNVGGPGTTTRIPPLMIPSPS